MELGLWLAFLGASVAISLSPGPGAVYSMANGLNLGIRRAYWGILGLQIGLTTQLTLVAVGVGAVLAGSAAVFAAVKWCGVAYLAYLAIRQWRSAGIDVTMQAADVARNNGPVALAMRGTLVNLTNPKGVVFLLAVLPQFVVPDAPLGGQYLAIGATMIAVDLVVMGGYASLAARVLRWLKTPRQQTALNRTFAGLFATAAVLLSLVRRAAPV